MKINPTDGNIIHPADTQATITTHGGVIAKITCFLCYKKVFGSFYGYITMWACNIFSFISKYDKVIFFLVKHHPIFNVPVDPNSMLAHPVMLYFADILFGVLALASLIPIISFILYAFGNTVGKSLFGLKIENIDKAPLTYKKLLLREWKVFLCGNAMGIRVFVVIANIMAYLRLRKRGITSWDESLNTKIIYSPMGPLRWIIAIGLLMIINLAVVIPSLLVFAPDRLQRYKDINGGDDSQGENNNEQMKIKAEFI